MKNDFEKGVFDRISRKAEDLDSEMDYDRIMEKVEEAKSGFMKNITDLFSED